MRTNEPEIGLWLLKTEGDPTPCWPGRHLREPRRTGSCARPSAHAAPDLRARRVLAQPVRAVEPGSCFRRQLLELALACDRSYMLALPDEPARRRASVSEANFGLYPMATGQARIAARFYEETEPLAAARAQLGQPLDAEGALALGLVTAAPDDIDWADEIRIAIEERVAMSPDALTGMEANLRFNGPENMNTASSAASPPGRTGSSSAPTPSATKGALKVYGTGEKPSSTGTGLITHPISLCGANLHHRNGFSPACTRRRPVMTGSTTARRSPTTSTSRGPHAAARARAVAAQLPAVVERHGPGRASSDFDVYLRTAVSVDPKGWAQFDHVKMPDYRWGIFLNPPEADRKIHFGDHKGEDAWQDVPGEYRANLRRIIVTQGDTEPASVEQQRHLGLTAPRSTTCATCSRSTSRKAATCGRWSTCCTSTSAATAARKARRCSSAAQRRRGQPAHPGRVQREDARLAVLLHVHLLHRPRRQVPARALAESGFDPLART
jgi:hypothetical protein